MRSFASAVGGFVLLHLTMSVSCAHTDEAQQKRDREQEREVGMIKERMARMERRLADLDAKLSLVVDEDPPGASRRISSRDLPELSNTEGPLDYQENRLPPPPEDKAPVKIGIGSASVDIGAGGDDPLPEPEADEPPSPDTASGPPVTIDENLLREFGLEPPASETSTKRAHKGGVARKAATPRGVKSIYRSAHTALNAGDYDGAAAQFRTIEKRFGKHHLADNALYWRGVCYQRSGDRAHAVDVYQTLPKRFPKSPKIPDALFNLAEIAEVQGDKVMAKSIYARLLQRFPGAERSAEAAQAVERLSN